MINSKVWRVLRKPRLTRSRESVGPSDRWMLASQCLTRLATLPVVSSSDWFNFDVITCL